MGGRLNLNLVGGVIPYIETLLLVGFKPYMPQHAAGFLILPPISVPRPETTHLAATMPASPPDEPPHLNF